MVRIVFRFFCFQSDRGEAREMLVLDMPGVAPRHLRAHTDCR